MQQAAAALNVVDNWTDLLTLADIPPDFVILYERVLRENEIGFEQAPTITLDLLNSLGFKMGHLMKIMKVRKRARRGSP